MIWLSVTPKSNAQFISEAILDNLDKAGRHDPGDLRHRCHAAGTRSHFRLSLLSGDSDTGRAGTRPGLPERSQIARLPKTGGRRGG